MKNLFKEMNPFKKTGLPKFTQETGISQITDLESLEKFIKFLAPENFFQIKTYSDRKCIEITAGSQYFPRETTWVRISEENNILKVTTHTGLGDGYDQERSFEKNEITKMSKEITFLIDTTIPLLEYRLWRQNKNSI